MSLDGIDPGGEGAADDLCAAWVEGVGFLLPRARDNGDPVHVRTGQRRPAPPLARSCILTADERCSRKLCRAFCVFHV